MAGNEEQPRAVPVNLDLAHANNNQGAKYDKAGQHSLAEIFFRAAYACHPDSLHAAGNVILSLNKQQKFKEAVEFAHAEFENNKDKPWFVNVYTSALMEQGKYKAALALLEKLKGMEPYGTGTNFEFKYGRCLYKTGKVRDAEIHFKASNQLKEGAFDYDWLTACFRELGRFSANESFMLEKLRLDRDDTELSIFWRRYCLADYYEDWAKSVEGSEEEKLYLLSAKKYVKEALGATDFEGDNGMDKGYIAGANELLKSVSDRIFQIEGGFEPPSLWSPGDSAPD